MTCLKSQFGVIFQVKGNCYEMGNRGDIKMGKREGMTLWPSLSVLETLLAQQSHSTNNINNNKLDISIA